MGIGTGSTLQSETGGRLLIPNALSSAPTHVWGLRNFYDLRKGRLAIRFTRTGTADTNAYTMFGLRDNIGYRYGLFARSTAAGFSNAYNDLGAGTATDNDTTVGLGPSWVANSYIGWAFNESTKTYTLSKSTDGTTWTVIHTYVCTSLGSFNFRRAQLFMANTSYGTPTTFTGSWDDATYFVDHTNLRIRTRAASGLVASSPKIRTASGWSRVVPKVQVGGYWSQSG